MITEEKAKEFPDAFLRAGNGVKMFKWAGLSCFLQIETEARMGSVCIKSMDAERNSAENVQKESNMKRTEEDMDM